MPVGIGGFHVSGCIAMLPEMPQEIARAQALGISLFAGEAEEGRLDEVLRDAYAGKLKPLYNFMNDLPALEGQPPPILPRSTCGARRAAVELRSRPRLPFQCSFCTIINVQGRKSRFRTPDDLEAIVRENARQGITASSSPTTISPATENWEALFDRLIELREHEGLTISSSSRSTRCATAFPISSRRRRSAGVNRVFIGLENINPDNLLAAKKRQNKITEYRLMLQKWRDHGCTTYAGYIRDFRPIPRSRSFAISRSSSANCRSIYWSSSF